MNHRSPLARGLALAGALLVLAPGCEDESVPAAPAAVAPTPAPTPPVATPLPPAAPALSLACQAQPRGGEVPLTVSFRSFPSGGTGSYGFDWSFGDGGSSTQPHPRHTYLTKGTFLAALTVTSGDQTASCQRSITPGTAAVPAPLPPGPAPSPGSSPAPLPDLVITILGDRGPASFSPDPADLRVGQRVIWRNSDVMFHTASAPSFDTGLLAAGAASAPITLGTPGSFPYRCALHSGMVGTLRVIP